jgi:type I restriction enzyme S subunit
LGECCILKAGNSISSAEIHKFRDNKYMFPCYGGNGIRGYVNKFSNEGEFPIIGRQGALCGNISYAKGKYYSTEHAVTVNSNKSFIPRFLYYLLITLNLNQYATAGAQPGLSVNRINRIYVPIPPLSEQERIVAILDKFDALINDISIGLPAEIAALQKKYEYYRNKLLTFDALEAK